MIRRYLLRRHVTEAAPDAMPPRHAIFRRHD